ncbi:MAG: hypothetical protein IT435_01260 [Phycisphaerales bacterium]|nr:hypothetical protein [Phycisphaerales bacterium]
MDDALTDMGLEGATLAIREAPAGSRTETASAWREVRRLEGDSLRKAVRLLRRFTELVEIAERRGVRFIELLQARGQDPEQRRRLPTFRVSWRGGEAHAWSDQQAHGIIASRGLALADAASGNGNGNGHANGDGQANPAAMHSVSATIRELHENRELDRLFVELSALGIDIEDYGCVQREAVTGEKLPCKYAWLSGSHATEQAAPAAEDRGEDAEQNGLAEAPQTALPQASGKSVEAASPAEILDALHALGRRGLEIKRFKGLGEMDAEQLWETTMDVSRRTLLRVSWDTASEADALFSVLMGEEVEPRRKFIEDHALEVKNLDV